MGVWDQARGRFLSCLQTHTLNPRKPSEQTGAEGGEERMGGVAWDGGRWGHGGPKECRRGPEQCRAHLEEVQLEGCCLKQELTFTEIEAPPGVFLF